MERNGGIPVSMSRGRPAPQALELAVDDDLRGLEIDGYRVVFTRRVTLLPVELTPLPLEKSGS